MRRSRIGSALALLMAAPLVASCAPTGSLGAASSPSAAPSIAATAVDGPFTLVLTLPRATWSVDEAIEGEAVLSVASHDPVEVSGSGSGLMFFTYREIGGSRYVEWIATADCVPYRLDPVVPLASGLGKSGGWSADDPNASFYAEFVADPVVHLPVGAWDITALASFLDGLDCLGAKRSLTATVRIEITD